MQMTVFEDLNRISRYLVDSCLSICSIFFTSSYESTAFSSPIVLLLNSAFAIKFIADNLAHFFRHFLPSYLSFVSDVVYSFTQLQA